jgi:hypothetical protein
LFWLFVFSSVSALINPFSLSFPFHFYSLSSPLFYLIKWFLCSVPLLISIEWSKRKKRRQLLDVSHQSKGGPAHPSQNESFFLQYQDPVLAGIIRNSVTSARRYVPEIAAMSNEKEENGVPSIFMSKRMKTASYWIYGMYENQEGGSPLCLP